MIKPPAMGVFARDPPPPGRASISSASAASSSTAQLQSIPSDLPKSVDAASAESTHLSTAQVSTAADDTASDPILPDDEAAQDDDDQGTVDEEAGIIRCICGCDDDDGFTIQCDRCLVWQHCACFGMSQASVPDEYLCEQCEPRPVDVAFAQAHQQKRKNNEARKALMDRNLKRQAHALASTTYSQTHLAQDPISSPTSSSHPASSAIPAEDPSLTLPSHSYPHPAPSSAARSRKPSQALDLTNTHFVVPEVPASAGAAHKGGKQRKGHKGSRRGYDTPSSASTPVRGVFTPGSSHDRLDDPFDQAEQLEAWHVEFTPIAKNVVPHPSVIENLAAAMLDWEQGSPLKGYPGPNGRVVVPTASSTGRHLAATTKQAHAESLAAASSASSPSSSSSPRAPGSPNAYDDVPITISAVGDECIPIELTGSSLADLACRTYVKHISESASAGVFSNVLYVNNSADEPQRGWCASRAFSRPVMHGLFADASIPAGAFISEYRGELYSASAYRNDPINQYAALGATKPYVHLLPPPLNLAIDARRYGNEARFARFSCHPNAVLRPILFHPNGQPSIRSRTSSRAQSPAMAVTALSSAGLSSRHHRSADTPPAESRSEEPQLLFGIFALTDIPRTHEITLGWEWDDAHIVHFLPELVRDPYLELRDGDFDADKHTANMVALAEKGDFPYADTEFSVKMSTVAAALLGCVLCACIGSAAPPGGGGGASSNNGRKQDCAVAQMLRVGNGMSLLNVTMPGKNSRRAKLPDFSPLVGIRRHWRPFSLPPTPETSVKDEASSSAEAAVLDTLSAEHDAETMRALEDMEVDAEVGCGGNEAVAAKEQRNRRLTEHRMDIDDDAQDTQSAASASDDADDTRSIASSLTDPLSGLSANETLSEDEDEDLMDVLRAADGIQARPRSSKGGEAGAIDAELSGLFLLPPKKRSMRTRIKATVAPSDDEGVSGDEDVGLDDEEDQGKRTRKSADTTSKAKAVAKRKGKLGAGRSIDFSSDEEQGYDDYAAVTPVKKRRKSGNIADPSSPLSSVPSPDSADSSLSPPPPVPRLSAKHRRENEKRISDVELSKKKREAQRARDRNARAKEARPKESASKRRKREETRIHRNAILDLGDTESSEDDLSDDDADDRGNKQRHDEEADVTIDAGSGASTPRTTKKALPPHSSDETPSKMEEQDTSEASMTKKETLPTPTPAEERQSAKKDTPTKTKKVRRILSDSEPSSDEEGAVPAAPAPKNTKREEALEAQIGSVASEQADGEPAKSAPESNITATDTAQAEDSREAAQASATAAAPSLAPAAAPAAPEVKKEEPRVKLSLAEYKRRLAERRVSENQGATSSSVSAPPLTPTLATPTSEVAPSPAVERSDPLPSISARPSEATVTPTPSEATPVPSGSAPPTAGGADAADTGKTSAAVPRGVLFTSISAPTAIRSVEIPKSPSPEPATSFSTQQQQQQQSQSGGVSGAASKDSDLARSEEAATSLAPPPTVTPEAGLISLPAVTAASPQGVSGSVPGAGAAGGAADTPALLMRLETRRARAPSVSQQPQSAGVGGEKDGQHAGAPTAADGFVKPQTTPSTGAATTPAAGTWGASSSSAAASASTPARSPSLGPTRVHGGGHMPPSPSGSSGGFNPPKAPRAFMSPPGTNLPAPSMASASAVSASGSTAPISAATTTSPAVTSTPARIGIAGVAAAMGNTPSTASSASSTSSRYPAPGLTSPTPTTSALPPYPPRNFAGVPKGPASMRDADPRAEAWAEAREAREARDARGYAGARPVDPMMRDGARDMGWGERSREPAEREPMRAAGGWGARERDRRESMHPRSAHDAYPGPGRDAPGRFFGGGRDDRDVPSSSATGGSSVSSVGSEPGSAAGSAGLASRLDSHAHAHAHPHPHAHARSHPPAGYAAPYRRPSSTEYDDPPPPVAMSPYDRPSDPYNRGIIVRGRSLGLGGGGGSSSVAPASTAPTGLAARDIRERDYREYDDPPPPPVSSAVGARGGFRAGGWGRSRPRGPGGGRGRGGWGAR